MLEIQSLLQPVSDDAPGGSNLEYSPEYTALERALKGKPERRIGDVVEPAEPPDWNSVIEQASTLLRSSKDLRVAAHLARALLTRDGFPGLWQGLALIRGLLESFWPLLHPRLDEEDNDPTSRINIMATLTHRDTLQAVRAAPLVRSKAFGVVTLRDVEGANALPRDGSGGAPPSWDAMFQAMATSDLAAAAQAVDSCDREARELELAWKMLLESTGLENAGNGDGRRVDDFTELRQVLLHANRFMKERIDHRQASAANGATSHGGAANESGAGTGLAELTGAVRSREDVLRALEAICAYYARNEPSSPVPLLLERCKRLVAMSFLDIVKDMMPDGLTAIQTIAGTRNE